MNALIYFNKVNGSALSQKTFRKQVAEAFKSRCLPQKSSSFQSKRQRVDLNHLDASRLLGVHTPCRRPTRTHCEVCYLTDKRRVLTFYGCEQCDVSLCFLAYHHMVPK
eukprot:m.27884 g.27884  ORF g.27884 m.27884 type:complete len:108 (-) comp39925_c0_seq1:6-329(-)